MICCTPYICKTFNWFLCFKHSTVRSLFKRHITHKNCSLYLGLQLNNKSEALQCWGDATYYVVIHQVAELSSQSMQVTLGQGWKFSNFPIIIWGFSFGNFYKFGNFWKCPKILVGEWGPILASCPVGPTSSNFDINSCNRVFLLKWRYACLIHHAKFGCCFSYHLRTCRRSLKIWGSRDPAC